jgi:hypothetical protein
MLDVLRETVGDAALDELDATPLPDEPLDLSGVPQDIRDKVTEVADLVTPAVRSCSTSSIAPRAGGCSASWRLRSRASSGAAAGPRRPRRRSRGSW